MILSSATGCTTSAGSGSGSAASPVALTRSVAYVAYWDQENGFASIEQNLGAVTEVSPWWYSVDPAGNVGIQDEGATRIDADQILALQATGIKVIPTISNHRAEAWDDEVVGSVLADENLVATHIQNIIDLAIERNYDGIDVDYENLDPADRTLLSEFIGQLSDGLHARGKQLTVDLHAKTSDLGVDGRNIAQDYAAIGAAADQLRIMSYDYHWEDSEPGPVAPVDWVDEVLRYAVTQIPKEKIVVGISLVGYDWKDGAAAEVVTWQQAQERARAHSAQILRDDPTASPWFTYTDDTGTDHTVWFEDDISIAAKLQLIRNHGLSGVFCWRAGGEQPTIWPMVGNLLRGAG
jgi:spore germination protein